MKVTRGGEVMTTSEDVEAEERWEIICRIAHVDYSPGDCRIYFNSTPQLPGMLAAMKQWMLPKSVTGSASFMWNDDNIPGCE